MKVASLLFLLVALITPVQAADMELVFNRMNNFSSDEWAFTVVTQGEDDLIEQFDPRADPQWSLFTINEKTPTDKELKRYNKEKAKEKEEEEADADADADADAEAEADAEADADADAEADAEAEAEAEADADAEAEAEAEAEADAEAKAVDGAQADTGRLDLHDMVEMSSLAKVEETDEVEIYSFDLILDEEEKFAKSLAGKLWVNKADNYIERLDFFNVEPFSPAVSVTVKKLHTSMYFQKLGDNVFGPKKLVSEVKGKAFVFKSFDEREQQEFKNYVSVK